MRAFKGSFTQQEPLPEAAHLAANAVLSGGRLHRYGAAPQEISQAAALEAEFANWQGVQFCLALTSGGQAIQIALRSVGVLPKDLVLTNAFTLAPVPGAIAAVGAKAVLVESAKDLTIDLGDLEEKAQNSAARVLLLSHMRGHIADMDRILEICDRYNVTLVEDCAHTMGARFDGLRSGNHGLVSCFSTQTYKHINSGEGGLLTTNSAEIAARATMLSGSYMNFSRHGAGPDETSFETVRYETPNMSARMDNLRASILTPQLDRLDTNVTRWSERHSVLAKALESVEGVELPMGHSKALRVGSSFQFRLPGADANTCQLILDQAASLGVELKWFGSAEPIGFTSNHKSWRYIAAQSLPNTDEILSTLFDMRVPLSFSLDDCAHIGRILQHVLENCVVRDPV
ncbi:MAG: aminotransferase class I/II-fold pyridoxal phosphate-dependent enzyme [Boseongicola sp.]|nr:aminotransferase class I/II-fold pyridoxal phosphate-dependent enzyme [Boseongicola sp.]